MKEFKVGDVVKTPSGYIFEVGQIFKTYYETEVLRSIGCCGYFHEIESNKAVHATKQEVVKFYENKIKERQAKLEEAKAMEDEPVWPLPIDTEHYYFNFSGALNYSTTGLFYSSCNQALSEERATQLYEKTKLMQDMYLWVDTFCPEWKPDWSDINSEKWGIDLIDFTCSVTVNYKLKPCVFGISVPTTELAKKMLAEFKERIEKWY